MDNKVISSIVLLVIMLGAFVILRGDEDAWICVNNQWVKHGNPKNSAPVSGCGDNPTPTSVTITPVEKTVNEVITHQFSAKYQKPTSAFIIQTDVDTGAFAKGTVRYKGEMGGAIWFAAKTKKGWELAADGQGPMNCNVANKYNFPSDMVPACIDLSTDDLVKR